MDIRLTYAVRRMCFGLGRIKPELNGKHKLRSLPRESEIVTCKARHTGSTSPTAGRRTSYCALYCAGAVERIHLVECNQNVNVLQY